MNNKLLEELEDIVNKGLADSYFPVVTKNSVRIQHMMVRKGKRGYLVIDCKAGKQVAYTEFRSTALAIAKTKAKGKCCVDNLMELEHDLSKWYHDAIFYENTINTTTDEFIKESRKTRLDIAQHRAFEVRKKIDRFILS